MYFIFQNKQKIVQTLLKALAEVFVSISCAFYPNEWGKSPLLPPHTFIRFLNKINNLNDLFSLSDLKYVAPLMFNTTYIYFFPAIM